MESYVKSNAIVYAKNRQTIGVVKWAVLTQRVLLQLKQNIGCWRRCYGFWCILPVPWHNAAKAGIKCIIQPGGSMKKSLQQLMKLALQWSSLVFPPLI